nr:uncharacterized protein LOC126540900 [Dermacentor andersoni]
MSQWQGIGQGDCGVITRTEPMHRGTTQLPEKGRPVIDAQRDALRKEDEAALTQNAGDVLHTVGKLLQGQLSGDNAENRESILNALKTINTAVLDPNDTEQYFFVMLLKIIAATVISTSVSTGVAMEVDKALKKGVKKSGSGK